MTRWRSKFDPRDLVWQERIQRALNPPPRPKKPAKKADDWWEELGAPREYDPDWREYMGYFMEDPKKREQRDLRYAGERRFKLGELTDIEKEAVEYAKIWKEKYITSDRRLRALEAIERISPPKDQWVLQVPPSLIPGTEVVSDQNGNFLAYNPRSGKKPEGVIVKVEEKIHGTPTVTVQLDDTAEHIKGTMLPASVNVSERLTNQLSALSAAVMAGSMQFEDTEDDGPDDHTTGCRYPLRST